ncbi:RHS repeat-associated core domain-containing protein [Haliangium ochraceum]|uniref:YD repeat protein n=1 Tax=Haliangium ochraceum (strain DSM 14365 / JCM 11303 / SMP-2) TaxID=502025 RepID=D0LTH3_HALO1|nr:RHS repeat-associated core domain-containing protein [Haliangium ochraceum]ACY13868.1 YD repeat protein [Haliangium ochraceum DSM 14365]
MLARHRYCPARCSTSAPGARHRSGSGAATRGGANAAAALAPRFTWAVAVAAAALALGCGADGGASGDVPGSAGATDAERTGLSARERPAGHPALGAQRMLPAAFYAAAEADDSGTVVTSFYTQARAIFTGASPRQTGMDPETIDPMRASIVTGAVLGADGAPLALAQVSVRDHAEYGEALSDAQGGFALVVNSGDPITLEFAASGLITAQRTIEPETNESLELDAVKLIARDTAVSAIDFDGATTLQVHHSTQMSDARGDRQLSLLFYPGTVATLHMPDGTTSTVDELNVTSSEFTVGEDGTAAMPADIAFGTIYTYAVEFSAAEIESVGAKHAFFNPPAMLYLDNFLDIPVGAAVPAGSYDRDTTRWDGEASGQVLEILSIIDDGINPPTVELDLVGEDLAATAQELDALNITAEELEYLATTYEVGEQLWRVPVQHFTAPHDLNFPGGMPEDAIAPEDLAILLATTGRCRKAGSIIECENQVLGESLAVSDTPFALNYRSSRVLGGPGFQIGVKYTGDAVPDSLDHARVEVTVAGRTLTSTFAAPEPEQTTYVRWDGLDLGGNLVQGAQPARVCVTYDYSPAARAQAAVGFTDVFGKWTDAGLQIATDTGGSVALGKCYGRGVAVGAEIPGVVNQANMHRLGGFLAKNAAVGLGGWTLDVHHTLDPQTGTLYLGTGESREIKSAQPMAVRVAGSGLDYGLDTEAIPALGVPMEPQAIAIGPDSSIYVATEGQVRHVLPDGSWVRVAGTGTPGLGSFGGVARDTAIGDDLVGLELAANGDLFIADRGNRLIWMLRDGLLHRVAGNLDVGSTADMDVGFSWFDEEPEFDAINGVWVQGLSRGTSYPQHAHLRCLESIHLANAGQGMWIAQSCGSSGDQRIRYFSLSGDLTELDGPAWSGAHPDTGEYYRNRARISHTAGWPYPDWVDVTKRPKRRVGGKNPDHHHWGWYSAFGADNLPSPAGVAFGEEWALWKQPHSIVAAPGKLYVAEGKGNGDVSRIRQVKLGSGTSTLGLRLSIEKDDEGRYPCNSSHCSWDVVGDDGIEESIGQLALNQGKLYYSTITNNEPGVFMQTGVGNDGLPGRRVLGGGDERIEDEVLMTPALSYDLRRPADVKFGPDGALYVADRDGLKVVRVSVVSTAGYHGNVVASEDGTEYYVFDADGRHLSTHDSLTHVLVYSFAYDDSGLLTSVSDRNGNITQIHRDATGKPLSIESPAGRLTSLAVHPDGYLASMAAPSGDAHSFTYSGDGLLASMLTPESRLYTFDYDDDGRLIADTDAAGRTQTLALLEHTPARRVVRHTDPSGVVTDYAVDHLGSEDEMSFSQTWPDGTVSSRRTFADGRVQTHERDGTVVTVERAVHPQLGVTTSYISRAEMVAPGGGPTVVATREITVDSACSLFHAEPCAPETLAHDELYADRVTEITSIEGAAPVHRVMRRFTRAHSDGVDDIPAELLVVSAEDRASRVLFDELGRKSVAQLGTWDGAEFVHGGFDDLSYSYHPDGRLASRQEGSGNGANLRTYSYVDDVAGVTLSASSNGAGVSVSFDVDGWLQTVDSALGVTHFAIDGDGEVTGYRPPLDDWHIFDSIADDQDEVYQPASGTALESSISYEYRPDLQLSSVTEPGASVTSYGYDSVGRVDSITSVDGLLSLSYAAEGYVDVVTDPAGGTLDFDYLDGAPHALTRDGAESPSGEHTVSWQYDPLMRLDAESIDGGSSISYQYDRDGLPTAAGALSIAREAVTTAVDTMDLGTVHTEIEYDARTRPSLLRYSTGGGTLYQVALAYHDDGRIDSATETIGGIATSTSYSYDASGRLASVAITGFPVQWYQYGSYYDWSSVTRGGVAVSPSFDSHGRLDQFEGATYAYDAAGRRVSRSAPGDNQSYLYSATSQLVEVGGGSATVNYLHDGLERRVAKFVDGVLERGWLYRSPYQPVAELDASGAVVSRFVYATRTNVPDYLIRGGQTYQLLTDPRGSVRLVVDTATGAVAQRIDYDVWGRVLADSNPGFQPFGFAGGLYDPDTGLVHFGARDYDPRTGRFLQTDPRLFGGGYDNLYAYSGFDPVNYIDRTGEVPQWLLDGFTWADQAGVDDFIIGMGDGATLGISAELREAIGMNDLVDDCSWAYVAGDYAGAALVGGMAKRLKGAPKKAPKRGCFVAGTEVLRDGEQVAIEEVVAGDRVACADPISSTWTTCEVEAALSRDYEGELVGVGIGSGGDVVEATAGHPFWVIAGEALAARPIARDAGEDALVSGDGGARWVAARDLRVGDAVLLVGGERAEVSSVASSSAVIRVYNLAIAEHATYAVGELGALVHNDDDCYKVRNRDRRNNGDRKRPGEGFRGGKKNKRDRNFGIRDKGFWKWWEQKGKYAWGDKDLAHDTAKQAYEEWKSLGKPVPK